MLPGNLLGQSFYTQTYKPKSPKSGLVNVSGHCNKMAIIVDSTTTRCTITSIVIIYVRHQITSLQYGIKGGAQGTRWRPSEWQHVSSVSSIVLSQNHRQGLRQWLLPSVMSKSRTTTGKGDFCHDSI